MRRRSLFKSRATPLYVKPLLPSEHAMAPRESGQDLLAWFFLAVLMLLVVALYPWVATW